MNWLTVAVCSLEDENGHRLRENDQIEALRERDCSLLNRSNDSQLAQQAGSDRLLRENGLLRKLNVKLAQRIALSYLKPTVNCVLYFGA